MSGFEQLAVVRIPDTLLAYSHEALREIGEDEVEGLVLWAGWAQGNVFTVDTVLRPKQRALRGDQGLCVLVDGPEIHRINVWLYKNQRELVAQVHSHPRAAYHSELDDTIPLVTTVGGLSLVVPDFARGPVDLETYAGYRLTGDGNWDEIPAGGLGRLIEVFPDTA